MPDEDVIAVVGLGYVGLPLAVEFGRHRRVIGYDIDEGRVARLRAGHDATGETNASQLSAARHLSFATEARDLAEARIFIIAVPTPIDALSRPDLGDLLRASATVGSVLKPGDLVIYESTVYPGATEDECVPALERASGLMLNRDFVCGYSPERINPGDREHRLTAVRKITSGSTPEAAARVDALYGSVIPAGTYPVASIRIAEAAKLVENIQRDVNIALANEFAQVFNRMGLDTDAVLRAAATKWNVVHYKPGLVGGHCIGIDPYYMIHSAEALGVNVDVMNAARRVNEGVAAHLATRLVSALAERGVDLTSARILVLGLAYKENVPDLRNTRVPNLVAELRRHGIAVSVNDPVVDPDEARRIVGIDLTPAPKPGDYDGVILAVPHAAYISAGATALRAYGRAGHLFYDVKSVFPPAESDLRL